MKKLTLCIIFAAFFTKAFSQKVYFIYLQTENEQAFYVKLNEKVYSSSASGYVVLSKLRDTVYNFSIGFPKDQWPEQKFSVTINKRDNGYLIKNFGAKGWGLFNLQTMGVLMPIASLDPYDENMAINTKGASDFTATLALASNDPSLTIRTIPVAVAENKPEKNPRENTVAVKEESKSLVVETPVVKKEDSKPANTNAVEIAKKDESISSNTVAIQTKEESKPAVVEPVALKNEGPKATVNIVTIENKEANQPTENPTSSVKQEEAKPINNTVVIANQIDEKPVVNNPVNEFKTEEKKEEQIYKPSVITKKSESSTTEGFGLVFLDNNPNGTIDTVRLIIPNPKPLFKSSVASVPVEEKKFIDIPNDSVSAVNATDIALAAQHKPEAKDIKVGCTAIATHDDFLALRRIMAAAGTDADMITKAKKSFRTKCYTTEQIRNLSVLFLNDEYKFKFFDAASKSVSDIANFNTLQKELKDDYFIAQFKAKQYTN